MKEVDVLVVGAGPVGLNMALCLNREGIAFNLIDKKSGPTTSSNAVGVNCRSMEMWHSMGFLDEALRRGIKVHSTSLYSDNKLLNQIRFDLINSEYNFMLALPQAHTEQLLLEQLQQKDAKVNWNTELVKLDQFPDYVIAQIKTDAEISEIKAKWVIGCDGYRSSVREFSGLTRACHDLPLHFLMVDAEVSGDVNVDSINILFHDNGMIFMIPMRDNVRVVVEISEDEKYKNQKTCEPEIFKEILKERYPGINIGRVDWSSAFYIHECLADSYRKGRVFIAGDAAHTHSPMGGQGMNTGMQDTWNLAWKLGQVMRGEADEKLLDTYTIERRAIGHDVLERSGKLTTMATTTNFMLKHLRNFGIHHLADLDMVRSKLANGISQANICYDKSTLVHHDQVVKSGHLKYPQYQDGWTLLSRDLNSMLGVASYIKTVVVGSLPLDSRFCLVRPDGYTALYANSLDEIRTYLINNHLRV